MSLICLNKRGKPVWLKQGELKGKQAMSTQKWLEVRLGRAAVQQNSAILQMLFMAFATSGCGELEMRL